MTNNAASTTTNTGGSAARRRAATEQHERAIGAINAVFDRLADLSEARARLTRLAASASSDDPLRDAEALALAVEQLGAALAAVRAAASAAAEHRSRGDLAADVGTKVTSLFPRTAAPPPRPEVRGDRVPVEPSGRAGVAGPLPGGST